MKRKQRQSEEYHTQLNEGFFWFLNASYFQNAPLKILLQQT